MTMLTHIVISSNQLRLDSKYPSVRSLKKDQLVHAKVLSVISARRAELDILGRKVTADTFVPVKPGDSILLKVTTTGEQTIFKVVDGAKEQLQQISPGRLKAMGKEGPYALLEQLFQLEREPEQKTPETLKAFLNMGRQLFSEVAPTPEKNDTAWLKRWIAASGVDWERRVSSILSRVSDRAVTDRTVLVGSDLKAMALELLSTAPPNDTNLIEKVGEFINRVEHLQQLNLSTSEESGRYMLPFPFFENATLKFGQLLLGLGQKDDSSQKGTKRLLTVSLLLTMSSLGPVLADFSLLKTQITGKFSVDNPVSMRMITDNIPVLKSGLSARGFDVAKIECCVVSAQVLAGTSLVDRLVENESSMIHFVV